MSVFQDFVLTESKKKKKTPKEWLDKAADVAASCSFITHASKYTCSDGDVAVFWHAERNKNPERTYVSTDSVDCPLDAAGTASATPAGKILLFVLEDGISVKEHLKEDDDSLRKDIEYFGVEYDAWKEKMEKLLPCRLPNATDGSLSQVYFPVGKDEYHLLSVLPPSSVAQEATKRLWATVLTKREEDGPPVVPKDQSLDDEEAVRLRYLNWIQTKHGGDNPVNISVNNSNAAGQILMMESIPPNVSYRRKVRYPHKDFFASLSLRPFARLFYRLHARYNIGWNNKNIRMACRDTEKDIMEKVILIAYSLREEPAGWSDKCDLPLEQAIWLDEKYADIRRGTSDWLASLAAEFADWFVESYELLLLDKKIELSEGDGERMAIRKSSYDFFHEEARA